MRPSTRGGASRRSITLAAAVAWMQFWSCCAAGISLSEVFDSDGPDGAVSGARSFGAGLSLHGLRPHDIRPTSWYHTASASRKLLQAPLAEELGAAAYDGDADAVDSLLASGADAEATNADGNTPLILAATNGHVPVLRLLLGAGARIDTQGAFGFTALHAAINAGQLSATRFLLQEGASTEIRTDDETTPLILAVSSNNSLAAVRTLLDAGAMVDARGQNMQTPLLYAALYGRDLLVELFLEKGADVNATSVSGYTPLHTGARSGSAKIVRMLVEAGANIEAVRNGNYTPLLDGALWGRWKTVGELIKHEANVSAKATGGDSGLHIGALAPDNWKVLDLFLEEGLDIDVKNDVGRTAINLAAYLGNKGNIEFLISKGADTALNGMAICGCLDMVPNASSLRCQARQCQSKDDIDVIKKLLGAKAIQTLFDAAKAADLQAVKTLLEEGADVDATDSDGDTALHMAAAGGDADIVLALLDARANANIKDSRGDSPLHVASFYGHAYVVQILINRGAVLEERNNAGFTALHYASLNGHMEAVKTLLDAGADVNAQNFQTGATAILIATIGNLIDVVRLLIANGGDPTIPTDFGVSALHEAAAVKGSNALMELLINEGLDVDTLNYDGVTVLEFATYYGNADAVRFLLSKGASPYLGAGDGLFDKVCGCTDEVDRKARKCAAGGCQGDEDTAEIEELLRDARAAKPLPPTPPTSAPWSTPSPKPPAPYEGSLDCDNLLTLVARLECAVARASDLP